MTLIKEIENPEEELRKINKAISQYHLVMRTSKNAAQRQRAGAKMKHLQEYKEKILQVFDIKEAGDKENKEKCSEESSFSFLNYIMQENTEKLISDWEIENVRLYLIFFNREFLMLLSERKLHLDFQHSLERDGFYHRYQDIERKLSDLQQELKRIEEGELRKGEEFEIRTRIVRMKRALTVDVSRFFHSIAAFAEELIKDLENDGLKCLNGKEPVSFDAIEGKRYLEGKTVEYSLEKMRVFALEVMKFLDIPNFVQ